MTFPVRLPGIGPFNIPTTRNDFRFMAGKTMNSLGKAMNPPPIHTPPVNPDSIFTGLSLLHGGATPAEALHVQGLMNHGTPPGQAITHSILQSGGFTPAMKKAALLHGVDLDAHFASDWLNSRKVT